MPAQLEMATIATAGTLLLMAAAFLMSHDTAIPSSQYAASLSGVARAVRPIPMPQLNSNAPTWMTGERHFAADGPSTGITSSSVSQTPLSGSTPSFLLQLTTAALASFGLAIAVMGVVHRHLQPGSQSGDRWQQFEALLSRSTNDIEVGEQAQLLPSCAMFATTGATQPGRVFASPATGIPSRGSRALPFWFHQSDRRNVALHAQETATEASESTPAADVIVVGAGLAGLCAALTLSKAGKSVLILESSDGVGGRVRSDIHPDGYILDRGFQIFLSGYPEAQQILDYEELDLQKFYPGALVRYNGAFHRVADPFRRPIDGIATLLPTHPIGDVLDKIRVGLLRLNTFTTSWEDLLRREEVPTEQRLRNFGFSDSMIDRFFRPFLGGIFFDNKLRVSSRLMEFVIRVLAVGENCLPAKGIGAIPQQLAAKLPKDSIKLRSEVREVNSKTVQVMTEDGTRIVLRAKDAIIVATEGPVAAKLLGPAAYSAAEAATPDKLPLTLSLETASPNGTVCLYYAANSLPQGYEEPILYLDGEGKRLLNNMCFPSAVAPTYAPPGKHLVSVSLVGAYADMSDEDLSQLVLKDIAAWFGLEYSNGLELLRIYRIPFAQPNQEVPTDATRSVRFGGKGSGLYVCGDHRDTATFEGAMVSGRRAAEAVLQDI